MGTGAQMNSFLAFSPGDPAKVRTFFAPGRVNLIGEHTDYNGGDVLPAALELGIWLMVRPRLDGRFRFFSTAFPQTVEVTEETLRAMDAAHGFANYPKGVLHILQSRGIRCQGGDFLYHSNLPSGAGLSSSAAIEVVTAFAVTELADVEVPLPDLARFSQAAENEYIGVQCGIMDQFSVALGRRDSALLLHCATAAYSYIPLNLGAYTMVIANSNKQRSLSESAYNERRQDCEQALAALQAHLPQLSCLTELSPDEWVVARHFVTDERLRKRVDHVVSEHHRVSTAADRLQSGDLIGFGALLNASHRSLRDDYEVTGPELDLLAAAAQDAPGCIGSRMTGAGFGGCTISLVRREALPAFSEAVRSAYVQAFGYEPSFYESRAGSGVRSVALTEVRA